MLRRDGMRGAYSGREPGGIEMKTKMNLARGGASTSKKLLAAIAVLAVAFAVFAAIPAVADDSDAVDTTGATEKVQSGDLKYSAIKDALDAGKTDLKLIVDLSENVVIPKDKSVTLDLNGKKLTNVDADTIYVQLGATLVVKDTATGETSGTVDNITHGKAAVYNNGTVKLEGGSYTRSAETGKNSSTSGGNSYYNILNHGVMTVESGVTVQQTGHFSSLFVNGYFSYTATDKGERTAYIVGTNQAKPVLTINGGTFSGGINTIKTDDGAETTITGGTFSNVTQAVVLNANKTTITGGTFTSEQSVIRNGADNSQYINGELTITGGTFTCGENYYVIMPMIWYENVDIGTIDVAGGLFKDKPVLGISQKAATFKVSGVDTQKDLKYKGSVKIGTNQVTFEGIIVGDVPVTFSNGSVEISGSMDATEASAKITAAAGDVVLKDLTITAGNLTLDKDITVKGTLTVDAGAKVIVDTNAKLNVEGTVKTNAGATTGATTGAIENKGQIVTGTGANIADANITNSGNGQITNNADDSEMSEVTVGGISDAGTTVFTAKNIVTVNKSWTLINGSDVTINGKLVIPEGATLTIQSGAKLTLDNNAVFEIEGTLVIEEAEEGAPAEWGLIVKMGEVRISNSVTVNGPVDVKANGKLTIGQDGTLIIGTEGSLKTAETSKVTVDASGTLQVNGQFDGATIYNKGTVIINTDKTAAGTTTIYNIADGAVVDVVKFTAGASSSIEVNDNGLVFTTYRDSETKTDVQVTNNSKNNTITITPSMVSGSADGFNASVSGVKIVSVTSSKDAEEGATGDHNTGLAKGKQWTKSMDVSGSVTASYAAAEEGTVPTDVTKAQATIGFTGADGKIVVSGDLALADNITMTNAVNDFTVTGTISAVKSAIINNTGGKITVSGEGEISNVHGTGSAVGTVANTVSTLYITSVKDAAGTEVKTYHYVNIDKALAVVNAEGSAVKEITIQDNQTVKASSKVPTDVTLNLNGKKLTIDAKDNVTLTVVNGAFVKGTGDSSIVVKGTLFAENKNNVKVSAEKISADIYSEEIDEKGNAVKNGWAKWTNLTTALNEAKPGQKIVLKDVVTLTTNTTVPEGVTLEAGDKNIKLADGVTLTVDGILTTNADILAQSAFATTAQKVTVAPMKYSSVVVVNGKLVSSTKITYAYTEASPVSKTSTTGAYTAKLTVKSVVAGAYYEQDSNYVISSLKVAQAEFSTIQSKIVINGAVTAGDLAFTATEDCSEIEVAAAVDNGQIRENLKTIDTVFTVSSMTLNGMTLTVNGKITGTVAVGDAAIDAKLVSGIVVDSDESKLIVLGKIVSGTTVTEKTIVLDEGASLTVSKGTVYASDAKITSKYDDAKKAYVIVASGATLEIAGTTGTTTVDYIAVAGIVNVPSGKTLDVKKQADVTGAVTVAPATDSTLAGTFTVDGKLYVGITKKDITGAAASFNGPVSIGATGSVMVSADASVDDAFKVSVMDCNSTEFYVNGALWFSAYAEGNDVEIKVKNVPVADVKLVGWSKTDGGKAVDTTTAFTYTIGDSAKLYAVIVTEVYDIVIKADEGIANVYLDGQLMTYGLVLVAGENANEEGRMYYAYTATVAAGDHKVTYTLKNGWSGEATLYLNGTAVSGNTIKASGDFSKDLVFTLSGVQKSGYVDPTPAPSEDKDDGLTITDYLLIVLVVLIVILAVIVAMRLMRS